MKNALRRGSYCCVVIGLLALIAAFFDGPKMTALGVLSAAYFIGTPFVTYRNLSPDELTKMANGQIVCKFGTYFWSRLLSLLLISLLIGVSLFLLGMIDLISSILAFCGFGAILTAFVSPEVIYLEDETPQLFG